MKFYFFIILSIYFQFTIHLQASNHHFNGICSLPTEAQIQKFFPSKSKPLVCSKRYDYKCGGETYCAISSNICDKFLFASMSSRAISKPRMFGSQLKRFERFTKSIRKCNAFMILIQKLLKTFKNHYYWYCLNIIIISMYRIGETLFFIEHKNFILNKIYRKYKVLQQFSFLFLFSSSNIRNTVEKRFGPCKQRKSLLLI